MSSTFRKISLFLGIFILGAAGYFAKDLAKKEIKRILKKKNK